VRRRALHPTEITEAAIAAIEALNPTLNALVLEDFERARARSRSLDPDAPLAGVPFLIKDVDVHTEEWPTTNSSRFFADAKPRADSEMVRRWRRAGTVFLGKTNTPEFADDFVTEPEFRGVTRNPWDLGRTVGGSSGGAAAAVACGMVPVAHGSDVGGSIRVPSACCGLFGLKPSRGLNPAGPHTSELGGNLNCEHVLSRSVRDSAAFLDATAGPELGAPYRVLRPVSSYLAALAEPLRPLSVVVIDRRLDGTRVEPEIEARLADAAALLEALGHSVVPGQFPEAAARAAAGHGWSALWLMDIAYAIEERAAELGRPPGLGEIEAFPRHALATTAHGASSLARDGASLLGVRHHPHADGRYTATPRGCDRQSFRCVRLRAVGRGGVPLCPFLRDIQRDGSTGRKRPAVPIGRRAADRDAVRRATGRRPRGTAARGTIGARETLGSQTGDVGGGSELIQPRVELGPPGALRRREAHDYVALYPCFLLVIPAAAATRRIACMCFFSVGRVALAKALASGSCPVEASLRNSAMASWWALSWLLI